MEEIYGVDQQIIKRKITKNDYLEVIKRRFERSDKYEEENQTLPGIIKAGMEQFSLLDIRQHSLICPPEYFPPYSHMAS